VPVAAYSRCSSIIPMAPMRGSMSGAARSIASLSKVVAVIIIIAVFWVLFWRYCLAPNPLIREFFDLDRRKELARRGKKVR
jgi:hypothetical protein